MVLGKIPIAVMLMLGCGRVSPGDDSGDGETTACAPVPAAEIQPLDTPDVCTAYLGDPPPSGTDVDVVIVNHRDEPILLVDQSSGCHQSARWFQLDGEHEGHAVWLPLTNCGGDWPSCGAFTEPGLFCRLCDTLHPPIYIAPGGRFLTTYTTLATIEVELPAACTTSGAPEQCWAPTSLPPGTHQLRAFAGLASDCIMLVRTATNTSTPSPDCSCEVDQNGSCVAADFPFAADLPFESNLEATVAWNTECDVIELTFEP